MIGTTLSHFRILAKLGEGGMGVVYRAEDTSLRRPVALKVLPPERVGNEERRLRFLREARAAAAVTHPNIATIYEVGEEKGVVFIAMELVEGKTLRAHMAGRPLPIKEALRIAAAITEGLSRAHNARVIHRDLKPDNIMVAPDGHLKILDFGLAKLLERRLGVDESEMSRLETLSDEMTQEGRIFGTPAYMSPEQARGDSVDARSDLFSFGIILYEIVAGTTPFHGRTPADLLSAIIKDRPAPAAARNPDVPGELERLIEKCLEKDPADRYQHADEIVVDLKRLRRTTDSGVQAVKSAAAEALQPRPGAGARLARTIAQRPILAGALALVLVAAGAGTWALLRPPAPFREGEAVIVADFENATGDTELDSAVRDAFEERLAHSTFLEVIRGERLKNLLSSEERTGRTRLTVEVADQLCGGAQCTGIVTGGIGRQGTEFKVEAALKRPGSKRALVSSAAHAALEKDLLKAIHETALDLRRQVGESPKAVSSTYPPTTDSLPAYQVYAATESLELTDAESLTLVDRALALDPGFVDAYFTGATALQNTGRWREARKYAERARDSGSRFSDQVRLLSEILLLDAQFDHDRELKLLKSYRRLYPFDQQRANWTGWLYHLLEDPAAAEEHLRAAYELSPDPTNLHMLNVTLMELRKPDEIESLHIAHEKKRGATVQLFWKTISQAYARRDWKGAVEEADRTAWDSGPQAAPARYQQFWSRILAGRFNAARERFFPLWRDATKSGKLQDQLALGLTKAWLEMRRGSKTPSLAPELIANVGGSLHRLPRLATFCIEVGVAGPLEQALRLHEEIEKDSNSAFVREELQFARGSLALIRGDAGAARALLESVVRARGLKARHHALAKTYEALGIWPEAAAEYRQVVETWNYSLSMSIPSLWAIDHFRLARAYERMGDPARAREWYERFLTEWKDADPDIPEVVEARQRLSGN